MKIISIVCFLFLIASRQVYAASEYVLPYPGPMPGNMLYRVNRLADILDKYWSWGTLGTLKYQRHLSDKYLVEAKVLFEYKQYTLGIDALHRSDVLAKKLCASYEKVKTLHMSGEALATNIREQIAKHEEILDDLLIVLPSIFYWQEERRPAVQLHLHEELQISRNIRLECLQNIH